MVEDPSGLVYSPFRQPITTRPQNKFSSNDDHPHGPSPLSLTPSAVASFKQDSGWLFLHCSRSLRLFLPVTLPSSAVVDTSGTNDLRPGAYPDSSPHFSLLPPRSPSTKSFRKGQGTAQIDRCFDARSVNLVKGSSHEGVVTLEPSTASAFTQSTKEILDQHPPRTGASCLTARTRFGSSFAPISSHGRSPGIIEEVYSAAGEEATTELEERSDMFKKRGTSVPPAPPSDSSDTEARQRRRLLKPLTNQSATNLRLEALPQPGDGDVLTVNKIASCPMHSHLVANQPEDLAKSKAYESIKTPTTASPLQSEFGGWKGTAFIIKSIESRHSATMLPETPSTPTRKGKRSRPFSAMFSPRRSPGNVESQERLRLPKGSPVSSVSPATSRDDISDVPSLQSPFRASNAPSFRDKTQEPLGDQLEVPNSDQEWKTPPPVARTETPLNLDYTHLGGMRLGSLHIVNGRASPAPSEISKQFKLRPRPSVRRNASSEYGDSEFEGPLSLPAFSQPLDRLRTVEDGGEHSSDGEQIGTPNRGRKNLLDEDPSRKSPQRLDTAHILAMPKRKPVGSPDRTSAMAMAYMAELPSSPYSCNRPSSPAESETGMDIQVPEFEDHPFVDYFTSSPGGQTIVYESLTPTKDSPQASISRFQTERSPQQLHLPDHWQASQKSDSGYSSKVSLLDGVTNEVIGVGRGVQSNENLPIQEDKSEVQKVRPKPPRPTSILKQSGTSPPILPNFANLKPITNTEFTPGALISIQTEKPLKSPKPRKLQKPRPKSQPIPVELITVQGSHLDAENIYAPPIPPEKLLNLSIRAQEVPELERTFKTMNHTKNYPSMSDMSLVIPDYRFPSPNPEPPYEAHRSERFSFATSRRRSLTERILPTNRSSQQPTMTGISQAQAMAIIQGFGTVTNSLGGSPYDAIYKKEANPGWMSGDRLRMNPNDNVVRKPRPKSMMDDQTAAQLARLRSRSIHESDHADWNEKRSSFNDRGGIPGKNLHASTHGSRTPPLPPLPTHNVSWRRQNPRVEPQPTYEEFHSSEQHLPKQDPWESDNGAAPLPPAHSPRPSYIELDDDIEDMALAPPPPPPSHSPRPMTIETPLHIENGWAAQAEAWKSRRMAASGILIESGGSFEDENGDFQSYAIEPVSPEPTYPNIPTRQIPEPQIARSRFQAYNYDREWDTYPDDAQYERRPLPVLSIYP